MDIILLQSLRFCLASPKSAVTHTQTTHTHTHTHEHITCFAAVTMLMFGQLSKLYTHLYVSLLHSVHFCFTHTIILLLSLCLCLDSLKSTATMSAHSEDSIMQPFQHYTSNWPTGQPMNTACLLFVAAMFLVPNNDVLSTNTRHKMSVR